MQKIAFLLLFILYAGWSSAQIRSDDVLISRGRYDQLRAETRAGAAAIKRIDSLKAVLFEVKAEYRMNLEKNRRELEKTYQELYDQQSQVKRLQLALTAQRKQTNKYRYAYQLSGRYNEKLTTALVWGGLMSTAFIFSLNDKQPAYGYIIAAGGAATTLTLAFLLYKKPRKLPEQP